MTDEEYINLALQHILKPQQDDGININKPQNIGINPEQSLEQALIGSILNPSEIKTSGKYLIDSQGNEVALYEKIEGCRMNSQGITEEIDKEYYYTMIDGSSMSEFAECMGCGEIVHKNNHSRCTCGLICCSECGIPSKFTENKYYCCKRHRILAEGLF
ncbi:MAG: hypothetical protein HOC71_09800 [Candidatus Latescibacteria bacterium]|nr:hypothetical protein [Candidatus Latescibacterota bacterium]